MAADPPVASADAPWRSAPGLSRSPVSRTQIEGVITGSMAIFATVLGVQTVPAIVDQFSATCPMWNDIVIPLLYASVLSFGISALTRRFVRWSALAVAIVYLLAVLTWPLAVVGEPPRASFWLYFLMTVATGAAAIGFTTVVATAYLIVLPTIYGLIRLTPPGGSGTWTDSVLDGADVVILGGIVIVIVTMLRHAAGSVDAAQSTALERYAVAVRQHATEVERVQVDSIVHDSVLTTLLSAARAYTPEAKALAAGMAANAIGHLRDAAVIVHDDGMTVSHTALARRVTDAAETIGASFEIHSLALAARSLPVLAADAVYSAVVQAMVNSLQHGGGPEVRRWLSLRPDDDGGIVVEIGDAGEGFVPELVPNERLGLRVSILERMSGVGGAAAIRSAPGEGTVVTVQWPQRGQGWLR